MELVCASCGATPPADSRFCHACGTPLAETQAEGAQGARARSPADYTPAHLAEKILQSKSALEGERKQVTVLFADIKGSMELSEQVDPEVWHAILERFFQILSEGVHRFEGTVNQYTGDGIMALFGAPIAHEDHARRACYAALQLRDDLRNYAREVKREHGLGFSVRTGIHGGEVVVGKIGDNLRMDYTAQGHTVGLAARMQELASPDTIYVTGDVARTVTGYLELEDLGSFNVKGVSEPVEVFELKALGALRTRFDLSRARGLTRFVGRDDDMRVLESALGAAQAGNGQVVGVVANAGVGKSRLCFEFVERCRARGLDVWSGSAVAHGRNIPFLPVLQVCRQFFGITDEDADRTAREKIAGRMLLMDDSFRDVLPLLFEFMGVPDPERPAPPLEAEVRQRQLLGVVQPLMESRGSPFIILLEDLHWIDAGSEAFLEQWVDGAPGSKGLLLVNFRPEYHADWMQKSWYRQLPLALLGPEAIRELLDDLIGTDPSTRGLADAIYARTAGNPFFAEEVVLSCVEEGYLEGPKGSHRLVTEVDRLEVPATVQALLSSRIDRLLERDKRVLQTAAVIGHEFSEPILEAVAELPHADLTDALRTLKTAEFIREQALYPVAEYAFKHPLTQEVALHSQLHERQREVHAAVAQAIEEASPDKLDERAALLAHHWGEAGEAAVAAKWHGRAAKIAGANDPVEAMRQWRSVKTRLDEVPGSSDTAGLAIEARREILNFGWRQGMPREEAGELYAEALALAEERRDVAERVKVRAVYGGLLYLAGAVADSFAPLEEAMALANTSGDADLRFAAGIALANAQFLAGHPEASLATLETCRELSEADPRTGKSVFGIGGSWAWGFGAIAEGCLGQLDRARSDLDKCEAIARRLGETEVLGLTEAHRAWMAADSGDYQGALAHARQVLEISERVGSAHLRTLAHAWLGISLRRTGASAEAQAALETALELLRTRRAALVGEGWILAELAEACLANGDADRAYVLALEAVDVDRRNGTPVYEMRSHLSVARVLVQTRGAAARSEIESALANASELARRCGARYVEPLVLVESAALAAALGDAGRQRRDLEQAQRLFAEMQAHGHAERIARELAESA